MKLNKKIIKKASQLEDKAEGAVGNINRKQARFIASVNAKLVKKHNKKG